jgi:hypothetical protein
MSEQNQWADPTPVALFASGIALAGLGALLAGLVSTISTILLIPWLIGISFVVVVSALIMFRNGDMLGGTINLLIGAIFFGSGLWLSLFFKFVGWPPSAPVIGLLCKVQIPSVIEGYFNIPLVLLLLVISVLGGKISWVTSMMVGFLTVAVAFVAVWLFLGSPGMEGHVVKNIWANMAGWMLFAGSLGNLYLGTAIFTDRFLKKMVLPLGRPLIK